MNRASQGLKDEGSFNKLLSLGLTTKVALVLLSTNLFAVLASGLLYFKHNQNQLIETVEKHLRSVAQQESQLVIHTLNKHRTYLHLLASQLRLSFSEYHATEAKSDPQWSEYIQKKIGLFKSGIADVAEIAVLDSEGAVLSSTEKNFNTFQIEASILEKLKKESGKKVDAMYSEPDQGTMVLVTDLYRMGDKQIMLAMKTGMSELSALVDRHIGLGYTEETMLLYLAADGAVKPIVPLKFSSSPNVELKINPFLETKNILHISRYIDYRGESVFALTQVIPNTNWALVFKIDTKEALAIVEQQKQFLLLCSLVATLVVFVIAIVFSRSLTKPLGELTQTAMMIASGDLNSRIKWATNDEVGVLASAFNAMADRLTQANESLDTKVKEKTRELAIANEKLAKANRDLESATLEDSLTRIANRRAFDQAYLREWKRSSRTNTCLSLLIIDIDHFKRYNDSLGHHAGDDCLVRVASVLQRNCQRDNDLLARYGGEEFVILLPGAELAECENIAERIVLAMEKEHIAHPESPTADYVTVSIGIGSHAPSANQDTIEFFESVDAALYQAKALGRNQFYPKGGAN